MCKMILSLLICLSVHFISLRVSLKSHHKSSMPILSAACLALATLPSERAGADMHWVLL
jgi:hypothetical protein